MKLQQLHCSQLIHSLLRKDTIHINIFVLRYGILPFSHRGLVLLPCLLTLFAKQIVLSRRKKKKKKGA